MTNSHPHAETWSSLGLHRFCVCCLLFHTSSPSYTLPAPRPQESLSLGVGCAISTYLYKYFLGLSTSCLNIVNIQIHTKSDQSNFLRKIKLDETQLFFWTKSPLLSLELTAIFRSKRHRKHPSLKTRPFYVKGSGY